MSVAKKRPGLGRGLDVLLGMDSGPSGDPGPSPEDTLTELEISAMQPGKYQPRTGMDPERLAELADSIKAQGMIQPIVVRPIAKNRYEIIAGERRWRAAQLAGLDRVPVVLRAVPDQAAIAMALIENIQREDLNPLEEANALKRLIDEFALTHQQAAEAVGRSRAAVSNLLRLLDLPETVRSLLEKRRLEMGHARTLITLPTARAVALALMAADSGWSVRELEEKVRAEQQQNGGKPVSNGKSKAKADPNVTQLETELSERLATRVNIQHTTKGGKIVIAYHSLDELDGLLERLRR